MFLSAVFDRCSPSALARLLGRRQVLLLLFGLLLVAPARAQEVETDAASFFIETIVVEGADHASSQLIISESLIQPGQEYSEDDLRLAVYRIKRLPFILDARFSLRKGSERGFYELVITVTEPRRFFLGLDVSAAPEEDWSGVGRGTVGMRQFLGAYGVAFVALEGDELRGGYTHYNLFGKHLFASLEYGLQSSCCRGVAFDFGAKSSFNGLGLGESADPFRLSLEGNNTHKLGITLGMPLGRNQGLRFILRDESRERSNVSAFVGGTTGTIAGLSETIDRQEAELRWLYDTTDDPVVPSRGRLVTVALAGIDDQLRASRIGSTGAESTEVRETSRSIEARFALRQNWPLTSRQSLSFGCEVTAARRRTTFDSRAAGLSVRDDFDTSDSEIWLGYSRSMWGRERTRQLGDLRFEARLVPGSGFFISTTEDSVSLDFEIFAKLEVGVVFRSSWGLFRLRLLYDAQDSRVD